MARIVHCAKLKKDAEGLDFPPIGGPLGQRIYDSISKEAWEEWKKLQTTIINEYALNCADPNVRAHIKTQCEKFLFGEGIDPIPNYTPVAKTEEPSEN